MMDKALKQFDEFKEIIANYTTNHYSEADTRVKFIDPVLTNILGWDEFKHIEREENHLVDKERRCIDYLLSLQEPILVVEAKKNLKEFEIPTTTKRIHYSLNGVVQTWKNAWSTIKQVQEYCIRKGARYALVTNGHQYIAFKAICERDSWLDGQALVFGSLEILRENFTLFYESLSRETIAQDKLTDVAFPRKKSIARQKVRSLINITNSGYRNKLFSVLDNAFRNTLLDIQENISNPNFLKECYCSSVDAMRYSGHLNALLVDPLPFFRTPIEEVRPGHKKDTFDRTFKSITFSQTPLFVCMGGKGVGKTAFLHWYFEEELSEAAKSDTIIIFCDYRTIECNIEELHALTIKLIIEKLTSKTESKTTGFYQRYEIFRKKIDTELKGTFQPFIKNKEDKERYISQLLQKYQDDSLEHLKAIVDYLRNKIKTKVVVILDNLDQKDHPLQEKLFQIGNELVYGANIIVVVALRESSYNRMTSTSSFNAFSSKEFHIKAQNIDLILEKRLAYLRNRLSTEKVSLPISGGKTLEIEDLDRFLKLIRRSLLDKDTADHAILECITCVSNGDIREQLKMIYSFLTSGQTKIDDYFWNYSRNVNTIIPFHEVLHSLLLEDRKIFEEGNNYRFMNIFEPAPTKNSSHFTGLRMLEYIINGLGQSGELKTSDFVITKDTFNEFIDYGWAELEIEFHIKRFLKYNLLISESVDVENDDLLGKEVLLNGNYALTKCGFYYRKVLHTTFSYYSTMACDTSLTDIQLAMEIKTELTKGLHKPKVDLLIRKKIAELFLNYLSSHEKKELTGAIAKHPVIGNVSFVPMMEKF